MKCTAESPVGRSGKCLMRVRGKDKINSGFDEKDFYLILSGSNSFCSNEINS